MAGMVMTWWIVAFLRSVSPDCACKFVTVMLWD